MSPSLLDSSDRQHLMLLYDDESLRNAAEIECINDGLKRGQFCVFASVDVQDNAFMSKFAAKVNDFERQVREGNLLVVNFMSFYTSAVKADLTSFRSLKQQIESGIRGRVARGENGKTLIVADAACNLTKHKQFAECVNLEGWWQQTYVEWAKRDLDITIICAHPSTIFEDKTHYGQKHHIANVHSMTINLADLSKPVRLNNTRKLTTVKARPVRVLVAESEPDIQSLYKRYFDSLPVEIEVVSEARDCLQRALLQKEYDLIIIDSHLKDLEGIEVARKILEDKPEQPMVLTTTNDVKTIRARLKSDSLDGSIAHILVKPFRFSELLPLIKPARLVPSNYC